MKTESWEDRILNRRRAHAETCPTKGKVHAPTGRTCCDKAVPVYGICVCEVVMCCPDHGHACIGSHD